MVEPFTIAIVVTLFVSCLTVLFYFYYSSDGLGKNWHEQCKKLLEVKKIVQSKPILKETKKTKEQKSLKQKVKEMDLTKFQEQLSLELKPEYSAFLSAHLAKLTKEINKLKTTLDSAQSTRTIADNKIEAQKNSLRITENKASELKATVSKLNGEIQKMTAEKNEILLVLTGAQNENHSLLIELKTVKEEMEQLEGQIGKKKDQLTDARQEIAQMLFSLETAEKEKQDLLAGMAKIDETNKKLHKMREEMKSACEVQTKKLAGLEKTCEDNDRIIEQMRRTMQQMEVSGRNEREKLVKLHETERTFWQEEENKMQQEVNQTRILLESIEGEMSKFESMYESMQAYRTQILAENEELFVKQEELLKANNEMADKLTELAGAAEQVERLNAQLAEEKEKLQLESQKTTHLEKKYSTLEAVMKGIRIANEEKVEALTKELDQLKEEKFHSLGQFIGSSDGDKEVKEVMKDLFNQLEDSQNSLMEDNLKRCQMEKDVIDTMKATVEEVITSLRHQASEL